MGRHHRGLAVQDLWSTVTFQRLQETETMLRIRADVNGRVIGWVFIQNTGRTENPDTYDIASYDPGTQEMLLGLEGVRHHRELGWMPLVERVLHVLKEY